MYFAKQSHCDGMWQFELWQKTWSEEMMTNIPLLIAKKRFLFKRNGINWVSRIMLNILISNREFEIRGKNA